MHSSIHHVYNIILKVLHKPYMIDKYHSIKGNNKGLRESPLSLSLNTNIEQSLPLFEFFMMGDPTSPSLF